MDLHGRLLIHGATAAVPGGTQEAGGAIALIGRSRSGKSTLAAALVRRGCQLMGDDTAVLDRDETTWRVHGSIRHGSLRRDSAAVLSERILDRTLAGDAGKVRHPVGEPVHGTRRLLAVYVLDTGPDARIEPLSKYEAVSHALQNVVRFNPADRAAEADRFSRIHTLAQDVPAARLRYPRAYERLDEVCDVLIRAHA
jgi:hypothetical protein